MSIIQGKIITSPDKESDTIHFSDYTPHKAYDILTSAVYSARFNPDYSHINLEKIPPHTDLGYAKYDDKLESVIKIDIRDSILEDYGVKKE